MIGFLKRLLRGNAVEHQKRCFFEKGSPCDATCRAQTENGTCSIVERLRHSKDPKECSTALKALCNIDKDPDRIARDYPDFFPPPKLVFEE